MIDLRPQQVERTARGSRAINPPPLLVDEQNPISKARLPARTAMDEGGEMPYSMQLLLEDYEMHFVQECPWRDSHGVPSLVELTNHYTSCRSESYDWAQVLALAVLSRVTGSAYQ